MKSIDYRKSIQESLDYIEDNLKTPITATELCGQAGYSLFHYYRLFQSAVGMSVMQYILRRRLIHAIYEIRCGCKRIDVILEYGFDTYPSNIIVSQDEWGFIDFELSEKNLRIYDPCYAAMAILSESFDEKDQAKLSKWLEIYRNILWGYDSVVKLTNEECVALPYVVMADQLVSTAWFSEQDKYTELFETNKRMTQWLITIFGELKFN